MPNFFLRLLPLLVLLGYFASPLSSHEASNPRGGVRLLTSENGMTIDPNGGDKPGGTPIQIDPPSNPVQ